MNSPRVTQLVPIERVEKLIQLVRGEKVLLDAGLAKLYGVMSTPTYTHDVFLSHSAKDEAIV